MAIFKGLSGNAAYPERLRQFQRAQDRYSMRLQASAAPFGIAFALRELSGALASWAIDTGAGLWHSIARNRNGQGA